MDWSVRPNMIFAVAFDYSPLDRAQKKQVLDIVTKELLTPKGLSTLSPKSGGYNPNYVGPQIQRDYAYHQAQPGRGFWAFIWKRTCVYIR